MDATHTSLFTNNALGTRHSTFGKRKLFCKTYVSVLMNWLWYLDEAALGYTVSNGERNYDQVSKNSYI